MAASASDVRSILQLPQPQQHQGPPIPSAIPRKQAGDRARKPEGISRELYNLIGSAPVTLTAQYAKPKLKQKPDFGTGKTKWEWRPFTNSARTDNLKLHHWVKVGSEETEYPFAKYNTTISTYTYSHDEYTRLLEEPDWTKEETDYLFDLVKEYEMRWFVIHDRYEYTPAADPPRGIDDLKARYYGVCKKLIKSRPWAGDEASRNSLISTYNFDKDREINRKKYIKSLLSRTPEQIAEEEALFIEIKRLEQTERRFARERDDLLRTLLGLDSGLDLSMRLDDDGSTAAVLVGDKKRKRRMVDGIEIDLGLASGGGAGTGPSGGLRKSTVTKSNAYDTQHCITRFEPATPLPGQSTKSSAAHHTAVHLRSSRTPLLKASVASKIAAILDEMGVAYTKLIMPTQGNLSQLKGLFEAGEALVETKRAVDRVDQEIRVLKVRLGIREGSKDPGEEAMAVDGAEEGEKDAQMERGEQDEAEKRPAQGSGEGGGKHVERQTEQDEEQNDMEMDADEGDDAGVDAEADASVQEHDEDEDEDEGGEAGEQAEAEPEVDEDDRANREADDDDDDDNEDATHLDDLSDIEGEDDAEGDDDADADFMDGTRDVDDEDDDGAESGDEVGEVGEGEGEEMQEEEAAAAEAVSDEEEEEEEEDVSRSRSGRKRRTQSTSSMDTAGTAMTRRSSKRHKGH